MSDEYEKPAAEDDAMPARKVWSTPILTAVAADEAAGSFAGVGGDSGIYS